MEIFAVFILFVVFAGSALEKSDISPITAKFSKWSGGRLSTGFYSDRLQGDSVAAVKDYRFSFKEDGSFDYANVARHDSKPGNDDPGKFKIKDKTGLKI